MVKSIFAEMPNNPLKATARLLTCNPQTEQVTVLLSGIAGAVGVQASVDGTFVLVSEYIGKRISKYWLRTRSKS